MDIVFARSLFLPADLGGNRYPWEVTRRLARRGHRVRVVTPDLGGPHASPPEVELVRYSASTRSPLHTFSTNALGARRTIASELHRRRGDVVVLSSYEVAYGYYAGRRPPVPSVFIYHSSFYSDAINGLSRAPFPFRLAHPVVDAFRRHVEKVTFDKADRLVAVSPLSVREMSARSEARAANIRLIPTGVDTDAFSPGDPADARQRLGLPADLPVLLMVARLVPVKRHELALRALARLRDRGLACALVVAGGGPEEGPLRRLAAELQLSDLVHFRGFVRDERDLRDHYRAADLTLCTSVFENWSLAILESFAAGTPVVGTPGGSIGELLAHVDPALAVPDETPEAIASEIGRRLSDREALRRTAERGRAVVSRSFSWDRTVSELEACFLEAAGQRSDPAG